MWTAKTDDVKGTSGGSASVTYHHNFDHLPQFKMDGSASWMRGKSGLTDQKSNSLHKWASNSADTQISANYEFVPHFHVSLAVQYGWRSLYHVDDELLSPSTHDLHSIGFSPELSWSDSKWDGILMSASNIHVSYSARFGVNGVDVMQAQNLEFMANYEHSFIPGLKLCVNAGAVYSFDANMFFHPNPSSVTKILPGGYEGDHYFGVSAGLEKSIWAWKYLTLSATANYQVMESYNPDLDWQFDHGVGAGLRLYFTRIAVPAFSVSFNYNVDKRCYAFAFAMGMIL
jgi:hypothetical protein